LSTAAHGLRWRCRGTRCRAGAGVTGHISAAGARLHIPVHVVIGTFTFLDRNTNGDVGLTWKEWVTRPGVIEIFPCQRCDPQRSWEYFRRSDLHRLSAVDASAERIPSGLNRRIQPEETKISRGICARFDMGWSLDDKRADRFILQQILEIDDGLHQPFP
jgi:hypothetical protein